MRIMGLDYGDKTVGVAISDELLLTAQPVETIQRETGEATQDICTDRGTDRNVRGGPDRAGASKADGQPGGRTLRADQRVWRSVSKTYGNRDHISG